MRLIDADALMKEFAKFVRRSNNSDFAPIPTWNDAVSLTGSAPTVDAVERKKGKWMHKKITADFHVVGQCSVCKERRRIDNFCPNCGADMRGGEE